MDRPNSSARAAWRRVRGLVQRLWSKPRRRGARRVRPLVEALEDRFAPAVGLGTAPLPGAAGAGWLVRLQGDGDLGALQRLAADHGAAVQPLGVAGWYRVLDDPLDLPSLAALLRESPAVRDVVPQATLTVDRIPNDPSYGSLWGLNGTNGINAPAAWDTVTGPAAGQPAVTVAVIDTGIDYNHPDLYRNIWINQGEIPSQWLSKTSVSSSTYDRVVAKAEVLDADGDGQITFWDLNDGQNAGLVWDNNGDARIDAGDLLRPVAQGGWMDGVSGTGDTAHLDDICGWNFVANTNNPFDDHSHGTHVAGTIGAVGNNSVGVTGVSWRVQLMPLKFIAGNGLGLDGDAAGAVVYANARGARISNNSYGGNEPSPVIRDAVAAVPNHLYVVAAGNDGNDISLSASYPAYYHLSNMVVVAATDSSGNRASFSNYSADRVDLGAPGVGTLSTVPGGYGTKSGTSMATPHVVGVAALVLAERPAWGAAQLKSDLLSSTRPLASLAGRTVTGGLLDAQAATRLQARLQVLDGTTALASGGSVDFGRAFPGTPVSRSFTVKNVGNDDLVLGALSVPAGFSLTTAPATSTLAPGASTAFTLRLDALATGSFSGPVSLPSSDPNQGVFSFSVSGTVSNVVLLDNGDAGFSTVGSWTLNTAEGLQRDMHHISTPSGTGSRTASWTFTSLAPGQYRVSATWTAYSNRSTTSPFTVLAGSTALGTVRLNQQTAPGDFTDQGVGWRNLGTFSITGTSATVRLSDEVASGYVIADGVRLERIGDLPPAPPPSTGAIQDNGDAGFSTVGAWTLNTSEGYQGDMHHINSPGGAGTRTASWTYSGLTPGVYRVSATWTAAGNRATNSPFTVLNGSTALATVRFNQQVAPSDFSDQGIGWKDLGVFSITGTAATVRLSDDVASGYVIADAVRLERTGDLPPAPASTAVIVDNGDAGFSTVGAWTLNPSEGYQGDMHHIGTPGGTGSSTASWSFSGLTPGQYRVSATWTAYTNRAANSPFIVLDGSTSLGTVRLNQQTAPSDFTDQGVGWKNLGTFSITGTSATVRLSDDVASGYVIADGVRLERIGDLPPAPPPSTGAIQDNGDAGFSTAGAWTQNTSEGYQEDMHHSSTPGGTGTRTASWTFSGLAPGQYRVSATWTAYSNRSTNSPFSVQDGSTALGTVRLNQQTAPNDFTDQGVAWENLGTFGITSSGLTVRLSDDVASGYVIADAIRIQRLS